MAIDRGNVIPFSRGGIVERPILFPMARGAGLMGEAGPEGILPLKRNKRGELGVKAEGGGQKNVINIVNVASPDLLDTYLATARGQNAVMNVISSKSGTVKRVLRK
jgi:phage-related minor tail protein